MIFLGVFVVIVDKTLRGCGFGKVIMRHTEEFALKYGLYNEITNI
jgi:GNAT superfamily N-acetyltransferase